MINSDSSSGSNASKLYSTLHATAISFINSSSQDPTQETRISESHIRAVRAPSFMHTWGHNYAASLSPVLSQMLDVDGFITHLLGMTPLLESWETVITDVMVDEVRWRVVVRASYWMQARGVGKERVENDIVWFLDLVEHEGAVKVGRSVEFIDGSAGARLKVLMSGGSMDS